MRDFNKSRTGYDRVLMAVAATFLTVSAGAATAQTASPRNSVSELAIDAAVPRPEPANVPPPTASDIKSEAKSDTTASVSDANKASDKTVGATSTEAPKAADDAKSADAKSSDAKPADTQSADTKPAATTPAESKPVEAAKPADDSAKPADTAAAPAAAPAAPAVAATPAPAADAPKDVAKDAAPDTAKPASTVAAADQPVADKLREMLGNKQREFTRKGELAAVEKFYAARNYAPIWTQGGIATTAAKGVMSRLHDAAADAMNPADYPTPDFTTANTPDALAEAELRLTASALDYARQAQSGRMHWSQLSGDIQYPEHPTDPIEVLTNLSTTKDASTALDKYNPPQAGYQKLKKKLAELRGDSDMPIQPIAEGPVLKFVKATKKNPHPAVMDDPRVAQLRARLHVENASDTQYDEQVASAVRKFQAGADLKVTGILDASTVRAINAPKRDRQIDLLTVNMERWRWLPRQLGAANLGNAYVILNIPDYTLKVMQNGAQVWTTRVVVGKAGPHATPLLTETMKYITVNPTWNVPPSIIYNEYLPALQQDPTVLDRMGLKMTRSPDGSVHIAQPPGAANALGRIRFNFPNKFLVYQHDTPDKNLFSHETRAYSHGCMRVQNPDVYASTLLNITMPDDHYTPEKVRSMYGSKEVDLKFPTPIPVNITYQTAFVDDAGHLETRRDVYGHDAQMIALLKNPKGKDLEQVIAHNQPSYNTKPKAPIPQQGVASNDGPPNFFERLFGGGFGQQPQAADGRPRRTELR